MEMHSIYIEPEITIKKESHTQALSLIPPSCMVAPSSELANTLYLIYPNTLSTYQEYS